MLERIILYLVLFEREIDSLSWLESALLVGAPGLLDVIINKSSGKRIEEWSIKLTCLPRPRRLSPTFPARRSVGLLRESTLIMPLSSLFKLDQERMASSRWLPT